MEIELYPTKTSRLWEQLSESTGKSTGKRLDRFTPLVRMAWLKRNGPIVDLFDYACKLPRIAGVLPFVMRGMRIKVSKLLALYDITLVLLLVAIDAVLIYISQFDALGPVTYFVKTAQQLSTTLTISASLFWTFGRKSSLQLALAELNEFEKIVQPTGLVLSTRSIGLIFKVLFVIAGVDYFLSKAEFIIRIFLITRFHGASWMMFSISANFTCFVNIVDKSYRALSEFVTTNLKAPQNLRSTQKAAEHLVSACEALNAAFGLQMLLIASASFVLITSNTYLAIVSSLEDAMASLWWILIYSTMMLHLISSCTSAVEAADEFEKSLYRTVLEDRRGNLSQEVRSCLHFTNNRKVEFNAFGFFAINYTLAGSMIAAATTYLVILVQMEDSEKSVANATSTDAISIGPMKNTT